VLLVVWVALVGVGSRAR